MPFIRTVKKMQIVASRLRAKQCSIGFVPTMGALHEGHLSLIRRAAAENDWVVVSIFVNPLQFGSKDDLARYPRNLARDRKIAQAAGAEIIFAPAAQDFYGTAFQTYVEPSRLSRRWEGEHRAGHFRGVATGVTLLFNAVQPHRAYFGQKDLQQARIIEQLVVDLHLPIVMRVLPTVREPDGLAMSSRNVYLSSHERRQATVLHEALLLGKKRLRQGKTSVPVVIKEMERLICSRAKAQIDYIAVVDAQSLEPLRRLKGRIAILVAARIGRTRLIDNILVDVS